MPAQSTSVSYSEALRHSSWNKYHSTPRIIKVRKFLILNIFVKFGGQILQQIVGIPMLTNCTELTLYSHEPNSFKNSLKKRRRICQGKLISRSGIYMDGHPTMSSLRVMSKWFIHLSFISKTRHAAHALPKSWKFIPNLAIWENLLICITSMTTSIYR